jgi:prevent-host-death family protein
MATIPQKALRSHMSEVLRRAEAGEEVTITVAGRPVAQLGPTAQRQWVSGSALRAVWRTPISLALAADIARFP